MPNRLQFETSPYLLQHAENPVHWYPWCAEAFERAQAEDKPIFLSIGYSTCHWCHVMAHESFEDPEIADILNRHFISIKVDKEERPDIDTIYMTVCQAFTGSGGWPTSIFMTPEQKPFFAGTYFPKNSQGRMIGFSDLLNLVHEKWDTDREALLEQADEIVAQLKSRHTEAKTADARMLERSVRIFKRLYDEKNGGFGRAPKFPTPHNLLFLLEYYRNYKDEDCLRMAEHTLQQMYRGGLFDHIGSGFCRYSTDERFLVPHFEKMLYDNALLILTYCKAYAVTQNALYLEIAGRTADFILREMTAPDGAFYSALDADSHGEEGKYYLFTPEEITSILGKQDAERFNRHFGIKESGNFEGRSIPNLLHSDFKEPFPAHLLESVYQYRRQRYALHLDKKILTAWNGLMIAALCELYRTSHKSVYLQAAEKADSFLREYLADGDTLYASYAGGKRGAKGFLDDYAACIFAQLALHKATLNTEYLNRAKALCQKVNKEFADSMGSGFYFYSRNSEHLILRPKETYDGAMPSGNSLMAWNLVQLWHLTEAEEDRRLVQMQLDFLYTDAARHPIGHAMFLAAFLEYTESPVKITVVLARPEDRENLPHTLPLHASILLLEKPTEEFPLKDGKTTYYICRDHTCYPPVNTLEERCL